VLGTYGADVGGHERLISRFVHQVVNGHGGSYLTRHKISDRTN
jgi:hypothetical protein